MKELLAKLRSTAVGRLLRRFLVTGVAAVLPVIVSRIGSDPGTATDNLLSLLRNDWLLLVELFAGAGLIAGLDKLRREWVNL